MPGFNGTGPNGQGPMTGGGRGFCAQPQTGQAPQTPDQQGNQADIPQADIPAGPGGVVYGLGRGGLPRGGGRGRCFGGGRGLGRGRGRGRR